MFWKCREESDAVFRRLHEHLDHSGTTTEVAVNLERRVRIEQIRIGSTTSTGVLAAIAVGTDVAEQLAVDVISAPGILKTCKEVDTPSCAPSCCFVTLYLQRLCTCLCQVGRFGYGKVMARIESEEMGLVAVARILVTPVVIPLLQVAFCTNLVWLKTGECAVYFLYKRLVCAQRLCRLACVYEALAYHCKVGHVAVEG